MIPKVRMAFYSLPVFLIVMFSGCNGENITIAEKGKSPYVIILSSQSSPSEKHAAEELRYFIKLATGANLPIVGENDKQAATTPRIFVGSDGSADAFPAVFKDIDINGFGEEGFVLHTCKSSGSKIPDIVITGGKLRGTMYGVYTFLDKLGFRWYTNRITKFPENGVLKISQLDEKKVPVFMYREPFIKEAFDGDWAARNRVNSGAAALDSTRGSNMRVLGTHTMDIMVPLSLFKEHPEYFPLIGGKRVTGYVQRCLSNPEVVNVAAENMIKLMDENPNEKIFSLDQNDVEKNCECPECKKIIDAENYSGLYVSFVNKVAEIAEKKHPDKYISTLAYMFSEKPPKTIKPRDNVFIRLCPIFMCVGHPFTVCQLPETKAFNETLTGWHNLTDRIIVWHYCTDFAHYLMPFPNFKELTNAIKVYSQSGVKGLFLQGAYTSTGSSDSDMRAWVMARMLWEPENNPDNVVNEWIKGIYGNASEPMRAIYDLEHSRAADPKMHLRIWDFPSRELYPDITVTSLDSLFALAAQKAAGDTTALYYINKNRLGIKYIKLLRGSGELKTEGNVYKPSGNTMTKDDFTDFRKELDYFGITALREEPFDCSMLKLLEQRFEGHKIVSIENEELKINAVPDLGGRIINIIIKKTGTDILGKTDTSNMFYPAFGGYDEYTTVTWGSTGFALPYEAVINGHTLKLTGKASNGLCFTRLITLPENGKDIRISSSITNNAEHEQVCRLICHIELNADSTSSEVFSRDGNKKILREPVSDFYRDGDNKPAGNLGIKCSSGGWSIENVFLKDNIEACKLTQNKKSGTVNLEFFGFEQNLKPGEKLMLSNVWKIAD